MEANIHPNCQLSTSWCEDGFEKCLGDLRYFKVHAPTEHGDNPASYVSLPEGITFSSVKFSTFYMSKWVETTNYPWTPKPWKMKVLHPQNMGHNL